MKRKKHKSRFLQAVLLIICLASAGMLIQELLVEPKKNRHLSEQLKEEYPEEQPPGDFPPKGKPKQAGGKRSIPAVNVMAMQAKYPDIQGWLTIPGTNIDYPVLQSREAEPEYYLKRNYRGEWDVNGSLFLQWNCAVPESDNLIIYGHNMNSGAIFGKLDHYADADYWRKHQSVYLQTVQGMFEYRIVSVMKTDMSMFPFQRTDFFGEAEEHVRRAKTLGLFETGETSSNLTQILTLVTCSYEWNDARMVVIAVL